MENLKFIKTSNAPFYTSDLIEELKDREIYYELGDTGVYVRNEDLGEVEDIIAELEWYYV